MSRNRSTRASSCAVPVGVLLAGGASRRMGRDKALLEVDGRSLLGLAAAKLGTVCSEILVADAGRGYAAASKLGLESISDGPGAGPAAGILGAARSRPNRALLVVACDMPNISQELLGHIAREPADWAVPEHGGQLEPLAALYRPAALSALARRVQAGHLALHSLIEENGLRIHRLTEDEMAPFGDPEHLFHNLNRPEDLAPGRS